VEAISLVKGGQRTCLLRPVLFDDLAPHLHVLKSEFGVTPRSVLGVFVGDVAEREEDIYESARHAERFIAEASIDERHRGLRDSDAFGVKRQSHQIVMGVGRGIVPGGVQAKFCVGNEFANVLDLRAFAVARLGAHP
jgi:hypothetical protein